MSDSSKLSRVGGALGRIVPGFIRRRYLAKFLVIVFLVVLAIGTVGYGGYVEATDSVEQSTDDRLHDTASMQADAISTWVDENRRIAAVVADTEAVRSGEIDRIDAHFNTRWQTYDVRALHYVDTESGEIEVSTVVAGQGQALDSLDSPWANQETFERAAERGEPVVTDQAYTAALLNDDVIAFVAPVIGWDNRYVVVVAPIEERVSALHTSRSNQSTTILNGEGVSVLSGPEGADASGQTAPVSLDELDGDIITRDGRVYASAGVEATNWTAVTSTPEEEAYAVSESVVLSVSLIVFISLASLLVAAAVLGRHTVTPLTRLRGKVKKMEEGDLDVNLQTRRSDEIGQLYNGFATMRDSLKDRIAEAQTARDEAEAERERIQRINRELETTADAYSTVMQEAADGDLTARMDTGTENEAMADIATEFNEMLGEIEETVEELNAFAAEVATASEEVTASSEEVRSASEQISESVQEISAGAENQNESLQSVNQEMSDLSTTTEEIAASSNEVADIAERTADTGEEGQEAAQAAIEGMEEIEAESSAAVEEISQLEEEVGQIDELVERIQEIADQTNMLALNANIEASRSTSGEDDGGFGVVAQEVKELSQDAKDAAEEVEDRLVSIREQTQRSAEEVEQTSDDVDEASRQVQAAVDALAEIAEYAHETNTGVQEISAATEQQAASTQEVVAMVDEAATISEETTAEAESVAAAAEEQTTALTEVSGSASDLSEQAARLSEALDRFDTDADVSGGPETRMLEGDAFDEAGFDDETSEPIDATQDREASEQADDNVVEEDIDAFQPGVDAGDFGTDTAASQGAGEPPEGDSEASDAAANGAPAPSSAPDGAPETGPDAAPGDRDPANDADGSDSTGQDVFDFGPDEFEDAYDAADPEGGDLTAIDGVGETKADALRAAGFETVADVRAASHDELAAAEGIGDALAAQIKQDVGGE